MSTDPICQRCTHLMSSHTLSAMGCVMCACAEYAAPHTRRIEIDTELLEDIHAALERDWHNAQLTRVINSLLHPLPEGLTLRERVIAAMNNAATRGAACDDAIDMIYDIVVRTPAPVARTTVPQQLDAFFAGADRQRAVILDLLKPDRNADE